MTFRRAGDRSAKSPVLRDSLAPPRDRAQSLVRETRSGLRVSRLSHGMPPIGRRAPGLDAGGRNPKTRTPRWRAARARIEPAYPSLGMGRPRRYCWACLPPSWCIALATRAHRALWRRSGASRGLSPGCRGGQGGREFREFLTCGILAHGFVRLRCKGYALERPRHRGPSLHLDPRALSLRWGLPPYANFTRFVYALGAFRKSIYQQMHAHFGHGVDEKGFRDRGLVEAAKMSDRFSTMESRLAKSC